MVSRKRLPDDGDADCRIDDPAIAELLDTVHEARTSLAIELAAAAGALEAGRPEIARDIVAATAADLKRIGERSRPAGTRANGPRRRRRKVLLAVPAIPLVGAIAMTAAAALSGSSTPTAKQPHGPVAQHVVHVGSPHAVSTAVAAHDAATTTLHRLEHVVRHHPHAAQVLAVADDLHHQLTEMIATAIHDPARLHVVRELLLVEQRVLETSKVPGTQLALALSREIARLLEATPEAKPIKSTVPPVTTKHVPTPQPTSTTTPQATTKPEAPQASPATSQPSQTSGAGRKNALLGNGLLLPH